MSSVRIMPASVNYPFEAKGLGGRKWAPGAASIAAMDLEAGCPLVEYNNAGTVGAPALDGNNFVTSANRIIGLSEEPFLGTRYAAAVNGAVQPYIIGSLLLPGVAVEANLYYDGAGGATETIAQTDLFSTVVLKKLTDGKYIFDKNTTPSSMATFKIVGFKDAVGTVNGRVFAIPDLAYLWFGYALIA